MMKYSSNPLEIETGASPKCTVIFVHGLGSTAKKTSDLIIDTNTNTDTPLRYIFPNAPQRQITIFGGRTTSAWYDLLSGDFLPNEDEEGMRQTKDYLHSLLRREIERNIMPSKIFLAGFSQGGAMALMAGLRFDKPIGGIIALSAYLPLRAKTYNETHVANRNMPILLTHGTRDSIIPIKIAEKARETLVSWGHPVTWHSSQIDHSLRRNETGYMHTWINRCLKNNTNPDHA